VLDPFGLAGALEELIDLGMDEREKSGGIARQRIVREFPVDSIVHRMDSFTSR
jgi:hypothetical protein